MSVETISLIDAVVRAVLWVILVGRASLAWGGYIPGLPQAPAGDVAALRVRGRRWLPIAWLGLLGSVLFFFGSRGPGLHPTLTIAADLAATASALLVVLRGLEALEVRRAPA